MASEDDNNPSLYINMEIIDDNKIYEGDGEDYSFDYNFINRPWDDRSKKSKFGIVVLLVAIAAVITVCVINSFVMHYRGRISTFPENSCRTVKKEKYPYVARIYSATTKKLLCIGAVISSSSVIANEICTKSEAIRLFIGSSADPRCKKGFPVNRKKTQDLKHEGVVAEHVIAIDSYESLAACSSVIKIGFDIDWGSPAYIIGRPLAHNEKALTKQLVRIAGKGNCSMPSLLSHKLDQKRILCVKDVGRCVVRAGDLLVQNDLLFGIAATSAHRSDLYHTAYFSDLSYVHSKIKSKLDLAD